MARKRKIAVSVTVSILLKSQNKLARHLRLYPSKNSANSGYVNVWPNFSKYSVTLLKGRVKRFDCERHSGKTQFGENSAQRKACLSSKITRGLMDLYTQRWNSQLFSWVKWKLDVVTFPHASSTWKEKAIFCSLLVVYFLFVFESLASFLMPAFRNIRARLVGSSALSRSLTPGSTHKDRSRPCARCSINHVTQTPLKGSAKEVDCVCWPPLARWLANPMGETSLSQRGCVVS